jgi:PPOX class probable F420-dependent enzyme
MSMSRDEIDAFLDRRLVGALGTLRADGSPWVVPIWYRWDRSTIKVWSSPTMGWVKRLQDEPRVAFTVFEHEAPRGAVYIRGTATVREGMMEVLREDIRAVTARYVDADKVDDELRAYDGGNPKVVVTITPTFIKGEFN